jgi:hypothetical protein
VLTHSAADECGVPCCSAVTVSECACARANNKPEQQYDNVSEVLGSVCLCVECKKQRGGIALELIEVFLWLQRWDMAGGGRSTHRSQRQRSVSSAEVAVIIARIGGPVLHADFVLGVVDVPGDAEYLLVGMRALPLRPPAAAAARTCPLHSSASGSETNTYWPLTMVAKRRSGATG